MSKLQLLTTGAIVCGVQNVKTPQIVIKPNNALFPMPGPDSKDYSIVVEALGEDLGFLKSLKSEMFALGVQEGGKIFPSLSAFISAEQAAAYATAKKIDDVKGWPTVAQAKALSKGMLELALMADGATLTSPQANLAIVYGLAVGNYCFDELPNIKDDDMDTADAFLAAIASHLLIPTEATEVPEDTTETATEGEQLPEPPVTTPAAETVTLPAKETEASEKYTLAKPATEVSLPTHKLFEFFGNQAVVTEQLAKLLELEKEGEKAFNELKYQRQEVFLTIMRHNAKSAKDFLSQLPASVAAEFATEETSA